MSDTYHPENVFKNGPTNLDPSNICAEIARDKCAVAFSAGVLALTTTLEITEIIPNFVQAIGDSDISHMAQSGFAGVFVGLMSTLAVDNIRTYRKRWTQARYNQKLNVIAKENGINS